jgi:hypothetical protein
MASFTKLYLTKVTAPFTPTNFRGTWNDTAGAVTKLIAPHWYIDDNMVNVQRSGTASQSALLYRGVSAPISAQTVSGNFNLLLPVKQSAFNSDQAQLTFHVHVYVTAGDTDTVRGTLLTDYIDALGAGGPAGRQTNEWNVDPYEFQTLGSAQAMSSVGASAGDRLVVEIGFRCGANTGGSFRNGWLLYGTAGIIALTAAAGDRLASGDTPQGIPGWIEFSSAISMADTTDRLTQLPVEAVGSDTTVRISQLAVEALDGISQAMRMSQLAVEVLGSQPTIRMSQLCIEVLSPGAKKKPPSVFVIT